MAGKRESVVSVFWYRLRQFLTYPYRVIKTGMYWVKYEDAYIKGMISECTVKMEIKKGDIELEDWS